MVLVDKIEYHRLGGLNNKYLFIIVLEVGKSKIKVPANSVTGESALSGLKMAAFLPYLFNSKETALCCLLIRALIHHEGSTLKTSSKPNYIPKTSFLSTIKLGVRILTYDLGEAGIQTFRP